MFENILNWGQLVTIKFKNLKVHFFHLKEYDNDFSLSLKIAKFNVL